jgi:hypothetical protein
MGQDLFLVKAPVWCVEYQPGPPISDKVIAAARVVRNPGNSSKYGR